MVNQILKFLGIFSYAKHLRRTYFPSRSQKKEKAALPLRIAFYRQFLKPGELAFDIGANIGNRSQVFLELGARVVAVEPQSECATMLKHRFGKKIFFVKAAVGETERNGIMYLSDNSVVSSMSKDWIDTVAGTRFKDKTWNQTEEVKVITLDSLVTKFGMPSFCKIDVEGYEELALRGLSHPIPYISFEYAVPENMKNISGCFAQLSRIGRFDCNFTIGETMKLELAVWVDQESLFARITKISSKQSYGDIYIRFQ